MDTHDTQETPETLRADARRNRAQIIDAARTLFIRVGPDVPMEEIARAAGVGAGTLYRRFPDRSELIKAVTLDNFTRLAELAQRAERAEPDPGKALAGLLRSILELRLSITMNEVPARTRQAIQDSPAVVEYRDELIAVVSRLLRRAQDRGAIRPDIGIGDVALALAVVARQAPPAADEFGDMMFRRLFVLMMDGLRAAPGSPLPGRPVSDIDELRQRGRPFGVE